MSKDKIVAASVAVLMVATLAVLLGQGGGCGRQDGQGRNASPLRADAAGVRPIVVKSELQMSDEVAEMLASSSRASTTNFVLVPAGYAFPDNIKAAEDERIAKEKAEADRKDAMAALFAINHINWVVTKIKTYNDPIVLEEEYQGLTADAINLRLIKDPELIDLICRMLDVITEMRIEEKERNFLKEELDQGISDAMTDAICGFSVDGATPAQMIVSAITSAATAAMNYRKAKKALTKKFEKQSWALDKNRMYYLNDLNKELLRDYWSIVQKYPDLEDGYRVSEADIQLLVDHLKDEDAVKRHEFLVALEKQYQAFQPYWYHRAAAAHEIACDEKNRDEEREVAWRDADQSLDNFVKAQLVCGNILRKDPLVAKAALLQASALAHYEKKGEPTPDVNKVKYRNIIDLATKNCSSVDWQTRYFCALLAIQKLEDAQLAESVILPAIAELDWQKRRRLFSYKDDLADRSSGERGAKIEDLLPTGDALYDCRTLIAREGGGCISEEKRREILARICEDQNASLRAKIFCYGDMGYKQALEKLRPDLQRMRLYKRDNGHYVVSVPFSWVITRDTVMKLAVGKKEFDEQGERELEERPDGRQYVLIDYGTKPKTASGDISLMARFDRGAKGEGKKPNLCFMAKVEFSRQPALSELAPVRAYFGSWTMGDATNPGRWSVNDPNAQGDSSGPDGSGREPVYERIDL